MIKKHILLFLFAISTLLIGTSFTRPISGEDETIKWYTFEEAVELSKKNPKKIFIDVYTDWCGWCKKMDASTFKDKKIAKMMNQYYYAVKLDAEMNDTVRFEGNVFVNPNPASTRSTHQLAVALLNGQLSYPTTVYLDEKFALMSQAIPGYQTPESIEPILLYFGGNHHLNTKWDDFTKDFKSTLK